MTAATPAPGAAETAPATAASPSAAITLRSSVFRKGREASWRELEGLIARAERRGITTLTAAELERLPVLYRSAVSSLAVARSIALNRNLLLYLEHLSLRAFLAVYGPRIRPAEGIAAFFRHGLPSAVRGARWHALAALFCVILGVAAGFRLVLADEAWFSAIVPAWLGDGRGPASTREELYDGEIFAPWPGAADAFVAASNFLFTHNTLIGILTFGLGIAAGVPAFLLLLYQGLILGAFLALHDNRGLTVEFLGWVAIHGTTEFGALILCGAGGLVLADRILFPGRYARLESVAIESRNATQIAVGAILMFFIAAILEGGLRQLVASTPWRFAIGGAAGLAWLLYFALAGRKAS
jgi:uncharacterized membrane protein SpoIIM required for sporulation